MIDYKDRISSHPSNDEWRHYEFSRRSGLPWHYYRSRWTPDAIVVVVCIVSLIFAIGILWVTQ